MTTFFFGVINASDKGHFLYDREGRRIWSDPLPFRVGILDGGLLPSREEQSQGRCYRSLINGWTILTMWDRTADSRGNSNAAFIAEGEHSIEEMCRIAAFSFPKLWLRINPQYK